MKKLKLEDIKIDIAKEPIDEESWDLEKWREENPMDYLKALCLLEEVEQPLIKNEVFLALYKITRLHLPKILYKYFSLSDDELLNMKKFNTLAMGNIYMSDVKDFNDPFDSKGFFYRPKQLADIKRLASCEGRLIDDFSSYLRATSLTANGIQSMPMWAHYGSNHGGFCVAYDVEENILLKGCTFPVQYTNERVDITGLMRRQAIKLNDAVEKQLSEGKKVVQLDDCSLVFVEALLCNLKHSSWSYEKEFRCTIGAAAADSSYIEAKPKEIYIGMKCNPLHEIRLKEIGESWGIPVYKMGFDERTEEYCLIAQKI